MGGGASPDWYYMTVREILPHQRSWHTYIEGNIIPQVEHALDGLMEEVRERISKWDAEDAETQQQKKRRIDKETKFNPAAAAALQDSGPLEAHLKSLFRGFNPPVPWSEDELAEFSKTSRPVSTRQVTSS